MPSRISQPLRAAVRKRAVGRCEYCQSAEVYCGYVFEVDHLVPLYAGGLTRLDNLALACSNCNAHKAARVQAVDPESNQLVSLFSPRRDRWADHFAWSPDGTRVVGLTDMGRACMAALQMNNSVVVIARIFWVAYGLHPPGS
jgi:hypothetical protein